MSEEQRDETVFWASILSFVGGLLTTVAVIVGFLSPNAFGLALTLLLLGGYSALQLSRPISARMIEKAMRREEITNEDHDE